MSAQSNAERLRPEHFDKLSVPPAEGSHRSLRCSRYAVRLTLTAKPPQPTLTLFEDGESRELVENYQDRQSFIK
ncbi:MULTISPECIES: hypothetical protein [unclassified Coleofasciculus]|uniref:hypothetical protein n=1 Tax=unclassified Coleofasciculus TaxID=2692782 RepID=UPI001880AB54|nr:MULTISPECIES: hypothetical protein [unclassified Coleofasciculus]MBE9149493.1 hypothetical protein [Coleofasciculus sp. LEGE 07092]